eukprot:2456562-Rhodomonas_salina.2
MQRASFRKPRRGMPPKQIGRNVHWVTLWLLSVQAAGVSSGEGSAGAALANKRCCAAFISSSPPRP